MCPNRQKLGRDVVQLFSDRFPPGFPPFLSDFRERSLGSVALVFVFHWIRNKETALTDSDEISQLKNPLAVVLCICGGLIALYVLVCSVSVRNCR